MLKEILKMPLKKQKWAAVGILFLSFLLAICISVVPLAMIFGPATWWTLLPLGVIFIGCSIWMLRWQEKADTETSN